MILESIYEPTFQSTSHGFRPGKSCHTALSQIQKTFTGVSWFVEGDIKGCFDNIDHHILVNILKRRIKDEAFIDLIWKLLRAGYLEDWMKHQTYSGTPQGSGVSPLLANIYMNELDLFMEKLRAQFGKGRQAAVQQRLCQCQPPLCANQRTKRQKMEHHERRRTERRQSHAEEITGNPAIYPQSGANGPQLSQSSICPLRR